MRITHNNINLIIYHLYSDKKTIIDIKSYKSLNINYISDMRNENNKQQY